MPVEIHQYDSELYDDSLLKVKAYFYENDRAEIARKTGIQPKYIDRVRCALSEYDVRQVNQLARVPGIGIKTVEHLFALANSSNGPKASNARG